MSNNSNAIFFLKGTLNAIIQCMLQKYNANEPV